MVSDLRLGLFVFLQRAEFFLVASKLRQVPLSCVLVSAHALDFSGEIKHDARQYDFGLQSWP